MRGAPSARWEGRTKTTPEGLPPRRGRAAALSSRTLSVHWAQGLPIISAWPVSCTLRGRVGSSHTFA